MAYYLNESLISWVSQKQRVVSLSSCGVELMATTAAACRGIWLRNVLSQITSVYIGPVTLYIDNMSAIDLAKIPSLMAGLNTLISATISSVNV